MLNRNISQSQYDYEAYQSQSIIQNQQQHRYYSPHVSPPPAYSDMSSPSSNPYSISSRFSAGIAASSTPRNGTISINVTPNSSMTNGFAFRPSQPPPAPPPNYVGYIYIIFLFLFFYHHLFIRKEVPHYLFCYVICLLEQKFVIYYFSRN